MFNTSIGNVLICEEWMTYSLLDAFKIHFSTLNPTYFEFIQCFKIESLLLQYLRIQWYLVSYDIY